ncbi:Choline monooxygenase, chloroplastic [Seminavis robusta]|uniref:Choline monooxygenase, chloroplastic n=1 Tax=Seminavis robusta TaxID=568900 RepID=A0A9N8HIX0_9STRA|nr:Choline monooxygenase, chloroplastic [Seminavis robusta]|eukprot:Sro651_g181630.1 Choline monooxygenase, chloroplastic (487) ;mRNA; r:50251-51862
MSCLLAFKSGAGKHGRLVASTVVFRRFLSSPVESPSTINSAAPYLTGQDLKLENKSPTVERRVRNEVSRYSVGVPLEESLSPPSSWYKDPQIFQLEQEAVFLDNRNNWVAVTALDTSSASTSTSTRKPGFYQTGTFLGQPYLLTRNQKGTLQAFYNVCTHMGSCLVGPWTNQCHSSSSASSKISLTSSLVGQSTQGNLTKRANAQTSFQCPYHGWQFNLDGRLTKATHVKGIQNFRAKDFSLKQIPLKQVGPVVFLNFAAAGNKQVDGYDGSNGHKDLFDQSRSLFLDRLGQNGFLPDLSNMKLVKTKQYTVKCNWKVFCDNYGDGCYHCSFAHADLAANIDETNYSTEILSPHLTIQQAPPSDADDERFGTKTAIYAQWYPNIMLNRYGPWLDLDLVTPLDVATTQVTKAWFLETDYPVPSATYLDTSLQSSEQVHEEDVFLCENVQLGLQSRGFEAGRYVPSKQIATYHFHQRLATDLRLHCLS